MSEDLDIPAPATYRVPRREGFDPGTKRLAIIAGGLGAALVAVVGAWSLAGHKSGHLPVIEADGRPIRVKPENPGGLQVAGANDAILSGDDRPQSGKLAPPPEVPAPQALRERPQEAPRAPSQAAAPPRPAPSVTATASPDQVPAATPEKKALASNAAPPSSASAPTGHAEVQLAALGSEEAVKTEWDRLSKKMPDVFRGHRPAVSKSERDGKTFWRLRTGGFTDIAQATAFCEKVRSKGAGCAIASF